MICNDLRNLISKYCEKGTFVTIKNSDGNQCAYWFNGKNILFWAKLPKKLDVIPENYVFVLNTLFIIVAQNQYFKFCPKQKEWNLCEPFREIEYKKFAYLPYRGSLYHYKSFSSTLVVPDIKCELYILPQKYNVNSGFALFGYEN